MPFMPNILEEILFPSDVRKGLILDIPFSSYFIAFLYDLFHRFNSIQSWFGSCNNPQCNSIRTKCDNDVRLWAGERRSLFGEVVQRKERIREYFWMFTLSCGNVHVSFLSVPLHTEGNPVDKNFQVSWHTGRCKLMFCFRHSLAAILITYSVHTLSLSCEYFYVCGKDESEGEQKRNFPGGQQK